LQLDLIQLERRRPGSALTQKLANLGQFLRQPVSGSIAHITGLYERATRFLTDAD
jgi:hypothetical protein